jgi:sulfate transport system permease protein
VTAATALGRWLRRRSLRFAVVAYLGLLVCLPVGYLFYEAFRTGWTPFWGAVTSPAAVGALWLSARIALVVVPASAIAGIGGAMLIARRRFKGRRALDLTYDIPVAVSPIIIGVALIFAYSRVGWFGPWLGRNGIMVIFSPLGVALATAAVTLPYMLRSIVPVLVELGDNQEQAARTLGAGPLRRFVTITLPAIRWATLYGVVLTLARTLGEFGAVIIVAGSTQTLPIYVYDQYENTYGPKTASFAGAVVLAAISIFALVVLSILRARERRLRVDHA